MTSLRNRATPSPPSRAHTAEPPPRRPAPRNRVRSRVSLPGGAASAPGTCGAVCRRWPSEAVTHGVEPTLFCRARARGFVARSGDPRRNWERAGQAGGRAATFENKSSTSRWMTERSIARRTAASGGGHGRARERQHSLLNGAHRRAEAVAAPGQPIARRSRCPPVRRLPERPRRFVRAATRVESYAWGCE
jgi:hypothetical protein